MSVIDSAKNALLAVLEAEPGEKILIIADQEKEEVANAFSNAALEIGLWVRRIILEKPKEYRKEVPVYLKEIVLSSNVDIFMNLLRGVAEEVSFRIRLIKLETRRKLRLAHCPGVTIDMLKDGALSLTIDEYRKMQDLAQRLLLALSDVEKVIVRNPHGTDVEFSVKGRTFFTDVKFDWKTMKWINIPRRELPYLIIMRIWNSGKKNICMIQVRIHISHHRKIILNPAIKKMNRLLSRDLLKKSISSGNTVRKRI